MWLQWRTKSYSSIARFCFRIDADEGEQHLQQWKWQASVSHDTYYHYSSCSCRSQSQMLHSSIILHRFQILAYSIDLKASRDERLETIPKQTTRAIDAKSKNDRGELRKSMHLFACDRLAGGFDHYPPFLVCSSAHALSIEAQARLDTDCAWGPSGGSEYVFRFRQLQSNSCGNQLYPSSTTTSSPVRTAP